MVTVRRQRTQAHCHATTDRHRQRLSLPTNAGRMSAGPMSASSASASNMRADTTDREDRIAELYERYSPQIAAYARRRASLDEAADVVSETFLVAWRRSEEIPAEPDSLPWLYGVARRVLANQRRSTQRRGRLWQRLSTQFAEHDAPIAAVEDCGGFEVLGRALGELSDDDAEILRLVAWEGMSPTQVAAILDIEPNAARQRLHRARVRLRRRLDELTPDVLVTDSCSVSAARALSPVTAGAIGEVST